MSEKVLLMKYSGGILNRKIINVYLVKDENYIYVEAKDEDNRDVQEVFYLSEFSEKRIKKVCKLLREHYEYWDKQEKKKREEDERRRKDLEYHKKVLITEQG